MHWQFYADWFKNIMWYHQYLNEILIFWIHIILISLGLFHNYKISKSHNLIKQWHKICIKQWRDSCKSSSVVIIPWYSGWGMFSDWFSSLFFTWSFHCIFFLMVYRPCSLIVVLNSHLVNLSLLFRTHSSFEYIPKFVGSSFNVSYCCIV